MEKGGGGGGTFIIHIPTHGVGTSSCHVYASSDCGIIISRLHVANPCNLSAIPVPHLHS